MSFVIVSFSFLKTLDIHLSLNVMIIVFIEDISFSVIDSISVFWSEWPSGSASFH